MSVEPVVLGTSTVAGGGAATVAALANTGNPAVVGIITGVAIIIVLGFITRIAQRNQ